MPPTRSYLLMGSGEFEPWSESVEHVALQGRSSGVAILPTASATEGDHVFERWGRMGLEHYAAMGVEARVVPVRTRADAERDDLTQQVRSAAMVFFSGGKPQYLASVLAGTRLWAAVLEALDAGVVYAGCSAGAMVASRSPETKPRLGAAWVSGLGLVPNLSIGVHWDRVRAVPGFRAFVLSRAKGGGFVGIDERTAILGDGEDWTVHGLGSAMVRWEGTTRTYRAGERFETIVPGPGRERSP